MSKICHIFSNRVTKMIIKRQIAFKLRPYGKDMNLFQIQMHTTFNSQRIITSTGCQINSLDVWNAKDEIVVDGYQGPKGDRKDYDADDLVGIKNSTKDKKLGYLKWFLKWATDKRYNSNVAYKTFKPTLKATQKKVIYLSKDELKTILNLELKGDTLYLEPIRDIFMFCCFSSLRYSDASSLKWNDVKEDHIGVTTIKTADSLSIEINDMMGRILEKYRAVPDKRNNLVFPYYTNQAMNRDLKKLCKLAGINEEIRITSYKGNERIDEIKEKGNL